MNPFAAREIMKKVRFLLVLFSLMAAPVWAAIFANDGLFLYSDGKRVDDNSVLVLHTRSDGERLTLCEKGAFWLRQGPQWSPGPYTFIQAAGGNILTFSDWLKGQEGRASEAPDDEYQRYLRARSRDAFRRVSVTIPTVQESPALDRKVNPPPPGRMTGGKLGHDRFFRVDLQSGAITQVVRTKGLLHGDN